MSKIEVNAIEPQSGTTLTLGASGDTITIPSGATINNQGSAVNFGPTGAVSWNTTKVTTGFTATAGIGYFCDTTSAAFTVTLPATPAAGAVVGICDYANTFATNNLTISRNGSNIGGVAANAVLSTSGVSITLVYVDATQGWIITDSGSRSDVPTPQFVAATGGTITTCGNFKIHTFTGPGTFTVCSVGNPAGSNSVDYLVVAGGGGGGTDNYPAPREGAGGGGGGFRMSNFYGLPAPTTSPLANPFNIPVTATAYPITVGAGGAGGSPGPSTQVTGNRGSNSVFSTITSTGGGGGGGHDNSAGGCTAKQPGGSGGGAGGPGGLGNTPPVSPPQGNNGGNGSLAPNYNAGGGGGGGAVGCTGTPTNGGNGGVGSYVSPSFAVACAGTTGPVPGVRYFAGGAGSKGTTTSGSGGAGGGAAGTTGAGPSGTTNTGGGGGGTRIPNTAGSGGSGIVIIRYKYQ